uniref:Auxin transport protein BIG n=1 Tax=Tanacetum cinerariifolium TaxID=118510 RepID=A0A6L2JBK5_TANCI|nr:auxin transport protein BIG [Tanacetum cinerariifolium]
MKEIQSKDMEKFIKLHIIRREIELRAREKNLFIKKLKDNQIKLKISFFCYVKQWKRKGNKAAEGIVKSIRVVAKYLRLVRVINSLCREIAGIIKDNELLVWELGTLVGSFVPEKTVEFIKETLGKDAKKRLSFSALEMLAPGHAVGKVMGRGRANVDNICKISGASVEISDNKSSRGDRYDQDYFPGKWKRGKDYKEECVIVEGPLFLEMIQKSRWRWNLLNLLMSLLPATLSAGENVAEYFELLFKMIKTEDARLILTVRGCLTTICKLITQEFPLDNRFMREQLLFEVLEALVIIRGLIMQKTKLISDCNRLLKDLLDSLLLKNAENKKHFIQACIGGLQIHEEKRG